MSRLTLRPTGRPADDRASAHPEPHRDGAGRRRAGGGGQRAAPTIMADGDDAPPLRWLVGSAEQRRRALQYWGTDTAVGAFNSVMHRGLRLLPIDWCSAIGPTLGQKLARSLSRKRRARATSVHPVAPGGVGPGVAGCCDGGGCGAMSAAPWRSIR